ncbi:MAG: hypothetical protein JO167_09055 [Alphaproteobacteria bacterium]|nr:hypothetical protein [Alphaproteobacteria bacterium]
METLVVDGERTDPVAPASAIPWGSIIAGAIVACAVTSVLLAFGSAIGLSVVSTSPSWRDTSYALAVVSGLYLLFIALCANGIGGYITGRLRPRFAASEVERERTLRDGLNGLMMWGLALVIAGLVAAGAAAIAGTAAGAAGGAASAVPSTSAGEGVLSYELDRLFRSDQHAGDPDWMYRRAEASRILMTANSHNGVTNEDRNYLTALVAGVTKIAPPDAEARTNQAIGNARTALDRARRSGIIEAFMVGAALLFGAVIAWFAAEEGGRERDVGGFPTWNWRLRHPVVRVG